MFAFFVSRFRTRRSRRFCIGSIGSFSTDRQRNFLRKTEDDYRTDYPGLMEHVRHYLCARMQTGSERERESGHICWLGTSILLLRLASRFPSSLLPSSSTIARRIYCTHDRDNREEREQEGTHNNRLFVSPPVTAVCCCCSGCLFRPLAVAEIKLPQMQHQQSESRCCVLVEISVQRCLLLLWRESWHNEIKNRTVVQKRRRRWSSNGTTMPWKRGQRQTMQQQGKLNLADQLVTAAESKSSSSLKWG